MIESGQKQGVYLPGFFNAWFNRLDARNRGLLNSGRFRSVDDAEESAYRINLEAADEIARQLRLRDLGGLIICDFIDMRLDRNKRGVERALRNALKRHKEHARALRMSSFGLIEMTRQRRKTVVHAEVDPPERRSNPHYEYRGGQEERGQHATTAEHRPQERLARATHRQAARRNHSTAAEAISHPA